MSDAHELDERGYAIGAPQAGTIPTTDIEPTDLVAFKSDRDGMQMLVSKVSHPFATCDYRQDGRSRQTVTFVADLVLIEKGADREARKAAKVAEQIAAQHAEAADFKAQQGAAITAQDAENAARIAAQNATMLQAIKPFATAGVVAPANIEAFKL